MDDAVDAVTTESRVAKSVYGEATNDSYNFTVFGSQVSTQFGISICNTWQF